MSSLTQDLWDNLCAGGRRAFLDAPVGVVSYAQMQDAVQRWLSQFDKWGLVEGDRILICSDNELAVISCFIAALLDGKVPVSISSETPLARWAPLARTTGAKAMVDDGTEAIAGLPDALQRHSAIPSSSPRTGGLMARFRPRDGLAEAGLPLRDGERAPHLPADDGLAYLLFTSGTTSAPTGIRITRANLRANLDTISRLFAYGETSRIFNDMDIAHADGMIQGPILALANGCTLIRSGKFTIGGMENWLNRVRTARATHFITVPTIWAMIVSLARHDDYFDAPELVSLQSAGAKLSSELWAQLEQRFGHPVANHYGLSETVTSALYAGPHPEMGGFGTIGKPIDCEARIDPGTAGDEAGELQLRGTNVFSGYWENAERTAASFTEDGWLRTGDLARRNDDGSYTILGRLKNVLMVGGLLVRPDEIDEAMTLHPAISESVTVGQDDETFGEVPVTALVLDHPMSNEELAAHARSLLEPRKMPRRFVAVASIPRGISGKAQLAEVRQMLAQAPQHPSETQAEASPHADISDGVLAIAADVFCVPRDTLSPASRPDDVAAWDSFTHLNLMLEVEQHFGIRLPASRIAGIEKLGDLTRAVAELSA